MPNYPYGKISPDDEGELALIINVEHERVIVRFPKPIEWFGLMPQQAVDIAHLLIKHAIAAGHDKPVHVTLGGRKAASDIARCPDCGEPGERKGHQTCQSPKD